MPIVHSCLLTNVPPLPHPMPFLPTWHLSEKFMNVWQWKYQTCCRLDQLLCRIIPLFATNLTLPLLFILPPFHNLLLPISNSSSHASRDDHSQSLSTGTLLYGSNHKIHACLIMTIKRRRLNHLKWRTILSYFFFRTSNLVPYLSPTLFCLRFSTPPQPHHFCPPSPTTTYWLTQSSHILSTLPLMLFCLNRLDIWTLLVFVL